MNDVTLAWNANAAINDVLLHHLTPAMLGATTPGGGYTVAQHLAHMVECLKGWTSELEASAVKELPDLYSNYDPATGRFDAEQNLERIQSVMKQTRDTVLTTALNAKDRGNLPHATVGKFLIHMMTHDAHHRGQILLALKTNGHALPDEESMWLPWRS
jgi:uncharacterized damage-inducible protein DinB